MHYFGWTFPIRRLLHGLRRTPLRAPLPGFGDIGVRPGSSDLDVVRQVFRERSYDIAAYPQNARVQQRLAAILAAGQVPVIIDAGANIGASSIWFAANHPSARVLAVEPDPRNAACCRANCADRPGITVVEAAIGSTPGTVSLWDPGLAYAWSVRTERNEGVGTTRVCTIAELVATVPGGRLFIAKIDIEGFESDLFAANLDWLADAVAVIIEPHDWMLPGRNTSREFQRAIAVEDFEIVIRGENLLYFHA